MNEREIFGRNFAIAAHLNANNLYGGYLPYQFHLEKAAQVARRFAHLLPGSLDSHDSVFGDIMAAVYCHDVLEETNLSYNDLAKGTSPMTAELVYLVTNEKGRNRKERAGERYYAGIRESAYAAYAVFVKLCDRIANVEFGLFTESKMVEMYRRENAEFLEALGVSVKQHYPAMAAHLCGLFTRDQK
jgi:(p)ppGpp synthase/HD superfamily hydrolase